MARKAHDKVIVMNRVCAKSYPLSDGFRKGDGGAIKPTSPMNPPIYS